MKSNFVLLLLSVVLLLSSCVSGRRYKAVENSLLTAETNLLTSRQSLLDLQKDTTRLGELSRTLKAEVKSLEEYNAYSQSQLYKQMNDKSSNLDETTKRLNEIERELKATKAKLATASASNNKNSSQLTKVEAYINAQNKLIRALRNSSGMAVAGFEGQEVEYISKDGKVRIVIPENVLFNSSSTSLTSGGERALMSIANVINQNRDFKVYIETHSDDSKSRNNWDFTSKRAINIAKYLVKGGVFPNQVVPSARAEFEPVAMNDTPQNKAKNRRVELVLSPSFQNMYDLLKMY
ncbi:MAG: OmpA family protein [Saprospiraceae bacterium]